MTCKIIAHASSRYAAKFHVQVAGRVYEAHVKDLPGEGCTVRIKGLERGQSSSSRLRAPFSRTGWGATPTDDHFSFSAAREPPSLLVKGWVLAPLASKEPPTPFGRMVGPFGMPFGRVPLRLETAGVFLR